MAEKTVKMGNVDIKQVGPPNIKSRPDAGPKPTASENPVRRKGSLDKVGRFSKETGNV